MQGFSIVLTKIRGALSAMVDAANLRDNISLTRAVYAVEFDLKRC